MLLGFRLKRRSSIICMHVTYTLDNIQYIFTEIKIDIIRKILFVE